MSATDLLDAAAAQLGYSEADGFVDAATATPTGARGFVWRNLRAKCRVEAAYFNGGVPLVAFARGESSDEIRDVHRRLWNFSRVPVLIASSRTTVDVFSCFSPPLPGDGRRPLSTASTESEIRTALVEFSRFNLEAGRTSTLFSKHFRRDDRVDRRLLDNLRELRQGRVRDAAQRLALDGLIGRSMFVRYLEDRRILSSEHMAEVSGLANLVETLDSGVARTYELFEALADRFNGDVFEVPTDEPNLLDSDDLSRVASFFRATTPLGQQSLWPFDFSIIPSELISSIYEQLLEETQRIHGAYYTPRQVVDLILDEVLPWETSSRVRVLDPACGSGIFLSEAFRRLAYGRRTDDDKTYQSLATMLTSSVFGVDRSAAAIRVAAFGLYLALLEEIEPPTAWREARLPLLVGSNLIADDFFSPGVFRGETFDVVVGNPPWQSRLSAPAKRFLEREERSSADQQMALPFVWKARDMLKQSGKLGFLLPAKPLLHNRSPRALDARAQLFAALDVEAVIDLSPLRRDLFTAAVAPAAALIAHRARRSKAAKILHVVTRLSPLQATVDGFVVTHDDVHRIPRHLVSPMPDVWKIYLWGSAADRRLISRLRREHPPVASVAMTHKWTHGQGFQVRGGDSNDASELVGMRLVPTTELRPFQTGRGKRVTDAVMHRPRGIKLFRGPHVLVRRGLLKGRPAAAYVAGDAAFTNGVLGIAGPRSSEEKLRLLTAYFNSSLAHYYWFMTSSSWGVERDFVEENEYLSFPFADASRRIVKRVLRIAETAEIEPEDDSWRKELDDAVFDAYELSALEVALVTDALDVRLDMFRLKARARGFQPPSARNLQFYARRLRDTLSESLPDLRFDAWMSQESSAYVVITVAVEGEGWQSRAVGASRQVLERLATETIPSNGQVPSTILQPSALILAGTEIHLVKPNQFRFWTTTSAFLDAAELVGSIIGPSSDVWQAEM